MTSPTTVQFKTTTSMDQLPHLTGKVLGVSSSVILTQDRINTFARATEDHQWIHVDPVKAAKGPFGGTIAHGYLTLSLVAGLAAETFEVLDASAIVNYGLQRVRFPAPVPVDSIVRLEILLVDTVALENGVQLELQATISIPGQAKPAVVATQLLRLYR